MSDAERFEHMAGTSPAPATVPAWSMQVESLPALIHDLRNQLAPIAHSAELIAVLPDSSAQARRASAVILRQAARVSRLLDKVNFATRVFRPDFVIAADAPLLDDLLDAAAQAFSTLWPHTLTIARPATSAQVDGAAELIGWVLLELLDAAATRRHDAAALALSVTVDELGVTVCLDAAPSVPPRRAARRSVFEPGADVGIACVHHLVRRMGGRIDAALGRGADDGAFTLCLRRAQSRGTAIGAEPSPRSTQAQRVLVVDDNRALQESLLDLVSELGHAGRSASSGPDALSIAILWEPDLVLIDVNLAGENGYEVAGRLRRESRGPVRIHMMSSEGSGGPLTREAGRRGLDGYIPKMESGPALRRLLPRLVP